MPMKHYRPEDILSKLRKTDIHISQGKTVSETIRILGVSDVTYCRWQKGYGNEYLAGKTAEGAGNKISDSAKQFLVLPWIS